MKKSFFIWMVATLFAFSIGWAQGHFWFYASAKKAVQAKGVSHTKTALTVVEKKGLETGKTPASFLQDPNIFAKLAQKLMPTVVNIATLQKVQRSQNRTGDLMRRFFERFFGGGGLAPRGDSPKDEEKGERWGTAQLASLGTGFVIDPKGLILTNHHVVEKAEEIQIRFTEKAFEKPLKGTVVGRDPYLDLALIQVHTKRKLKAVPLGDSDVLRVGEYVMAIGNPFGYGHSVTHGIISAKNRPAPQVMLSRYLQTDAPINPGNSGGPLVNLKGEVIGINNAIDARIGAQGIGFAIPINDVKRVLPQLIQKGHVDRGYLGVLIHELSPEMAEKLGVSKKLRAPIVAQVYPGKPAAKAGLKPYDIILKFQGKRVHSSFELIQAVTSVDVGKSANIIVLRNSEKKTFRIQVAKRPSPESFREKSFSLKKKKRKESSLMKKTGLQVKTLTSKMRRKYQISDQISSGVLITSVQFGSPGYQAGLRVGDVIIEIDRKKIKTKTSFIKKIHKNKTYLLRVARGEPLVYLLIILNLKKDED